MELIRRSVFVLCILFLSGCSLHKAEIVLVGDGEKVIGVNNGNRVIISDTIQFSAVTAWPRNNKLYGRKRNFNWRKPIEVDVLDVRSSNKRSKSVKLRPNRYVIVDITGVNFRIYSSDKRYGGY